MKKVLAGILLLVPCLSFARPRNPSPISPDQIWQNDLDLNSSIETINTHIGNGVVNVKDYGAKGDGTTDDTSSIQAALNTCKTVYIPSVTNPSTQEYKVTSDLILCDKQSVFGDGYGSIVHRYGTGGNQNVFSSTGATNVSISYLTIISTNVRSTGQDGVGVYFSSCSYVNVHHNVFKNPGSASVMLYNTNDSIVEGNIVSTYSTTIPIQSVDIFIKGASSRNTVKNNHCMSNGDSGIAIQSLGPNDVTVDNIIEGNVIGQHDRYGIFVYRVDSSGTVLRNKVIGNTVFNILGTSSDDGGVTKSFGACIYNSDAEDTEIIGNHVHGCNRSTGIDLLAPAGIGTTASSSVSIIGNTISSTTWYGITARDPGKNGRGTTSSTTTFESLGEILIKGNNIYGSGQGQIHVLDHDNVSIIGNTLSSGTNQGIIIRMTQSGNYRNLKNILIKDNNITRAGDVGISVRDTKLLSIAGNNISSCTSHGISLDTCTVVNIYGNTIASNTLTGLLIDAQMNDVNVTGNFIYRNNKGVSVFTPTKFTGNAIYNNTSDWDSSNTYGIPTVLDTTATPSVKSGEFFRLPASATAVTNFTNGQEGQILYIRATGGRTVTHDGVNIYLNGAVNFAMVLNNTLTLIRVNNSWWEIGRKI